MTSLPSGGRRGPLFQLGCTFGWKLQSQPPPQEGFQPQRQLLGGCWRWSCSPEHLAKSAGLVHVRGTGSQGRSIFKFSSQQESWYVGNLFPGCFLSAGGSGKPSRLVLAASVSELLLGRHIEKLPEKTLCFSLSSTSHASGGPEDLTKHFLPSQFKQNFPALPRRETATG